MSILLLNTRASIIVNKNFNISCITLNQGGKMTTVIDQKAYLRKYLSGSSEDKKKKKKKNIKGKGFKIIDDDLDISKLRPLDGDELDIYNEGEDAPQIAGIIDERPEELKRMDESNLTKWKVINQDDGFNSKLEVEEIKKNRKQVEKENEVVFGKMYSDSEDEKQNDSDVSSSKKENQSSKVKKKNQHHSDSDFSPPRKRNKSKSDSDASPPRKPSKSAHSTERSRNNDSDASPPRKKKSKSNKRYDSDVSPPRKSKDDRYKKSDKQQNSDSDLSPPRKGSYSKAQKSYDSDLSPPRKIEKSKERARKPSRWGYFEDNQEQTKSQNGGSSSRSRHRSSSPNNKKIYKESDRRSNKRDSDISSRKSRKESPKRRNKTPDSDVSPPRKPKSPERKSKYDNQRSKKDRHENSNQHNSGHNISPPRNKNYRRNSKSPKSNRMEKTLEGKQAGLQDALRLKEENEAFRRREDEVFRNMTDDISGRNAKTVSRKGKRETSEDRQKQKDKAERQKELDEKYKKWSKGLKQVEDHEAAVQDYIHEASKPLARYKDDADLEDRLKDIARDGDPMLKYIRDKKRERGELGPEKPAYKGNFPPNRFNIRPGYRWDGVDRSNGYEKKYFDTQSKKRAQAEDAYKWSTEDL